MSRCTCGSKDCLIRGEVGDEEFNKRMKKIIEGNLKDMKDSKEELLKRKIPEHFILYIVKNWEDNDGMTSFSEKQSIVVVRYLETVSVVHHYGKNKGGYQCLCMDGRDVEALKKTINSSKTSWKVYEKTLKARGG